jgi:lysophospholipid acyltransferase (LPLAT)-like uncharacterized protein
VKPLKKIIKLKIIHRALSWLAAQYIRLVYYTGAWQVVGGEIPEDFWLKGRPFILAFWHGRILMTPYCWQQKKQIHILMSQHRDGQFSAEVVSRFGIKTVAGSSSQGGANAFRSLIKTLKNGNYVGIAPDGPRGPRMRASGGIISVARLSGAPIIPMAISSTNGRNLSSWDRFLFAWPFGRRVLVWGLPIYVERTISLKDEENFRCQVEDALNYVTAEADRLTDRPAVIPGTLTKGEGRIS